MLMQRIIGESESHASKDSGPCWSLTSLRPTDPHLNPSIIRKKVVNPSPTVTSPVTPRLHEAMASSNTKGSSSVSPDEGFDEAARRLAQKHLHQSLQLPQTSSHGSLRVTFSTTSNFDQHELPVVLFIGPMFGSRYHLITFDKLAGSTGVRVIYVDRYVKSHQDWDNKLMCIV